MRKALRTFLAVLLSSLLAVAQTQVINSASSSKAVFSVSDYGTLASAVAAANARGGPAVVDMTGVTVTQHLLQSITLSAPITIKGCAVTISEEMTDPGQSSGGIIIAADGASIEGTGKFGGCVITRGSQKPVQNLIYSGTSKNVKVKHLEIDGNEDNQTYVNSSSTYFTGWKTSGTATSSGQQLEDIYLTRGGARGIDWRGVYNYYINDVIAWKNGYAVGGTGVSRGNSISVDVGYDGTNWLPSHDGTASNIIDLVHGDSLKLGNYRWTATNIVVRGAVDFGLEPWYTETCLDAVGMNSSTLNNFYFSNCYNATLNLNSYALSGTPISTANDTISNGTLYADSNLCYGGGSCNTHYGGTTANVAYGDAPLTDATTGVAVPNVSFSNVNFTGSPLVATNTASLNVSGGSVNGVAAAGWSALPSSGIFLSGSLTTNYQVRGVSFKGLTNGIEVAGSVTAPGACSLSSNLFDTAITSKWKYDSGAATICDASTGTAQILGRIHLTGLSATQALTDVATGLSGPFLACGVVTTTVGQASCTSTATLSYTNPGGATTPSLWASSSTLATTGLDKGACTPIYIASGKLQAGITVGGCTPSTVRYEMDVWIVQQ